MPSPDHPLPDPLPPTPPSSLSAVTALGAATTLGFSVLATVGAALHGVPGCERRADGSCCMGGARRFIMPTACRFIMPATASCPQAPPPAPAIQCQAALPTASLEPSPRWGPSSCCMASPRCWRCRCAGVKLLLRCHAEALPGESRTSSPVLPRMPPLCSPPWRLRPQARCHRWCAPRGPGTWPWPRSSHRWQSAAMQHSAPQCRCGGYTCGRRGGQGSGGCCLNPLPPASPQPSCTPAAPPPLCAHRAAHGAAVAARAHLAGGCGLPVHGPQLDTRLPGAPRQGGAAVHLCDQHSTGLHARIAQPRHHCRRPAASNRTCPAQVFAHSLFEYVELKIMLSHWTGLEFVGGPRLLAKRFGRGSHGVAGVVLAPGARQRLHSR